MSEQILFSTVLPLFVKGTLMEVLTAISLPFIYILIIFLPIWFLIINAL